MSFADLVRNAVALANSLTADLQVNVSHKAWTGDDDTGKPTYATAITRKAIVSDSSKRIKRDDGEEIVARTYIAFLEPIAPRTPSVSGRHDPLDERDQLTLPDGRSGPIVDTDGGLVDPSTGRTYFHQVWLG
jgi:hypothetical protein